MIWKDDDKVECIKVPAMSFADHPNLKLVDTTGAGDTFTAAYAVNVAQQQKRAGQVDVKAALNFATKAAFLCICTFGAMPSIPTWQDVEAMK